VDRSTHQADESERSPLCLGVWLSRGVGAPVVGQSSRRTLANARSTPATTCHWRAPWIWWRRVARWMPFLLAVVGRSSFQERGAVWEHPGECATRALPNDGRSHAPRQPHPETERGSLPLICLMCASTSLSKASSLLCVRSLMIIRINSLAHTHAAHRLGTLSVSRGC
jgi:hypothetical protein